MQNALAPPPWRRILLAAGVVLLIVALAWFATRIPRTITVFVIAAFIASAVHPIVRVLERNHMQRVWAIASVYTLLILLIVISLVIILPVTFEQMQALAQNVPSYLESAQRWVLHMQDVLRGRFPGVNLPPQLTNMRVVSSQKLELFLGAALASLGTFALNLATGAFILLSSIILSFFFLLNHRQLAESFANLFPAAKRDTARALTIEAVGVFGGFIAGQAIVSAITGIAIAFFTAIFGFKFALLLGLVSAIAYAIPIVGMLVAHVLGLVVAAPQGPFIVIVVQVVLFVVARISDNVLVPKIMGSSVGVSPIAVMFAVFAGGELFGLPGLILGIPAAALFKLLWRYFVEPWLHGTVIEVPSAAAPLPPPELPPVAKV